MTALHPQFITDTAGKKLVVISLKEYNMLMENLEELEDIKLYDKAKKEDDGKRVLLSDYLKKERLKMSKYIVVLTKKAQKQLDKIAKSNCK